MKAAAFTEALLKDKMHTFLVLQQAHYLAHLKKPFPL